MQSSSQIITTNKPTPSFFTGRMPFLSPNQQCQSTEWKNITFHGLAYPELTWGLPTLSLTTNSSVPWGRVAMPLISPLMPVPRLLTLRVTGNICNVPRTIRLKHIPLKVTYELSTGNSTTKKKQISSLIWIRRHKLNAGRQLVPGDWSSAGKPFIRFCKRYL